MHETTAPFFTAKAHTWVGLRPSRLTTNVNALALRLTILICASGLRVLPRTRATEATCAPAPMLTAPAVGELIGPIQRVLTLAASIVFTVRVTVVTTLMYLP